MDAENHCTGHGSTRGNRKQNNAKGWGSKKLSHILELIKRSVLNYAIKWRIKNKPSERKREKMPQEASSFFNTSRCCC